MSVQGRKGEDLFPYGYVLSLWSFRSRTTCDNYENRWADGLVSYGYRMAPELQLRLASLLSMWQRLVLKKHTETTYRMTWLNLGEFARASTSHIRAYD